MNRTLVFEADSNRVLSGVLAVMVHLLFLGALTLGISWQKRGIAPAVTVELWRDFPVAHTRERAEQPLAREDELAPRTRSRARSIPDSPSKSTAPARIEPSMVTPASDMPKTVDHAPAKIDMPTASRTALPAANPAPRSPNAPAAPEAPTRPEPVAVPTHTSAAPTLPTRPSVSENLAAAQPRAPKSTAASLVQPSSPADIAIAPKHPSVPEANIRRRPTVSAPTHAPVPTPSQETVESVSAPQFAAATAPPTTTVRPSSPLRVPLTPSPAVTPTRPTESIPVPDKALPATPRLEIGQRRVIPEARPGPAADVAPEPSADLAARAREHELQRKQQAQERKRQEAMKLAEKLHDESDEQLQEEAARDAASYRDDLQQRRKESRTRELATSKANTQANAQSRAAAQSLIEMYMAQISQKIRNKVVLPPDLVGNPEAVYEVELLSGGEVVSTRLRKSSGQPAYDASVERAILAAQPLPIPTDAGLFQQYFANFLLSFRPLE